VYSVKLFTLFERKKDENDKNLSHFSFGIGGGCTFFKEVDNG
jgi:hypothetical protein